MSKKKKFSKNMLPNFDSDIQSAVAMAQEFLDEASPFELSHALADLGVTTAHREGIFAALDRACPNQSFTVPLAPDKLYELWKQEIAQKKRTLGFEEAILLLEATKHWVMLWRIDQAKTGENAKKE